MCVKCEDRNKYLRIKRKCLNIINVLKNKRKDNQMTYVDVCVTYSIKMPEIDEIYNEFDDPDLADDKIDDVIEEIYNDPLYFIERNGYDMVINDINF